MIVREKINQLNRKEALFVSTKEIIQAFISPTEKLINSIAAAIGRIYEPTYVRKKHHTLFYSAVLFTAVTNDRTN